MVYAKMESMRLKLDTIRDLLAVGPVSAVYRRMNVRRVVKILALTGRSQARCKFPSEGRMFAVSVHWLSEIRRDHGGANVGDETAEADSGESLLGLHPGDTLRGGIHGLDGDSLQAAG